VVSINKSFSKTFKLSNDQAKGYNIFKLAGWNILPLKKAVSAINAKKPEFTDLNVIHKFPALGNKSMVISGKQILSKNKDKKLLLLTIRIVPQKKG
jgi:hypothetical protein